MVDFKEIVPQVCIVHLFSIETFHLEQHDLLEKNYSIMEKVNANVILNEAPII